MRKVVDGVQFSFTYINFLNIGGVPFHSPLNRKIEKSKNMLIFCARIHLLCLMIFEMQRVSVYFCRHQSGI